MSELILFYEGIKNLHVPRINFKASKFFETTSLRRKSLDSSPEVPEHFKAPDRRNRYGFQDKIYNVSNEMLEI